MSATSTLRLRKLPANPVHRADVQTAAPFGCRSCSRQAAGNALPGIPKQAKQTLSCKVTESYRGVPYISIGGSQRNVYFSLAQDGALIAKLQDYHIDVVLVVPVFGKTEPWARFLRSER